jgi:hypothetical protein
MESRHKEDWGWAVASIRAHYLEYATLAPAGPPADEPFHHWKPNRPLTGKNTILFVKGATEVSLVDVKRVHSAISKVSPKLANWFSQQTLHPFQS